MFNSIFTEGTKFKEYLDYEKSIEELEEEKQEFEKLEIEEKAARKIRKDFIKQQIRDFNDKINKKETKYRRKRNSVIKDACSTAEFKLPSIPVIKNKNLETLEISR